MVVAKTTFSAPASRIIQLLPLLQTSCRELLAVSPRVYHGVYPDTNAVCPLPGRPSSFRESLCGLVHWAVLADSIIEPPLLRVWNGTTTTTTKRSLATPTMPKRYFCEFCEKSFQDTPLARKRHLQGAGHQRNRRMHYDSFKCE